MVHVTRWDVCVCGGGGGGGGWKGDGGLEDADLNYREF